jgi:pantoate--beta-alanine ligase
LELTKTFAETRRLVDGRIGLVPTMGGFHEGHLSLMRRLRERCDTLVVSLFVNPTQFEREDDLETYPRDLEGDAGLAESVGVDVLFVPDVGEVYPGGSSSLVEVPGVSQWMEGRQRPGHFSGVATVVTKLFAGLRPDVAIFGRKDAQQLAVIRTLVRDLRFPVEILDGPLVRDPDGLALSSRNLRLAPADRQMALSLSRGLFEAAALIEAGERSAEVLERSVSRSASQLIVEYVTLADLESMVPVDTLREPAVLAAAVRVGTVRLIDNIIIEYHGRDPVPDRGLILGDQGRLVTLP